MKQLIAPVAIIVALIAFFIIVDRKEFNRYDNVQTVQRENPTTNRKPMDSVPETKPVMKSAGEAKSIETKTVAETKPVTDPKAETEVRPKTEEKAAKTIQAAETKPAEEKQVETKPGAEAKNITGTKLAETKTKSEIKSYTNPSAVPVATAEEGEKLNENAMAYLLAEKEKREPFYNLYQDTKLESICFQGTIRATSTIPDPEKNDYANCLYALFVEIDALLSDATTDTEIACEVMINVPIMKNKTILHDNIFMPGDRVWCACAEYDAMPQAVQEIQLSDDIQSFEHQQYYPIKIRKISTFQKGGNRNFTKREITILPIQTLPRDEKAITIRKERIQNEIARIEEDLNKHGGSFEEWNKEYMPIVEKNKQLSDEGYSAWINDSFFAAGIAEPAYKTDDYVNGILPYKKYLDANNIDLIVVRVPTKQEFARCVLASDQTVFQDNPAWIEHYYSCLKNDIEIIDPMPEMWKHRFDFPLFYFYHVPSEGHPFEGQSFISAKVLSEVLKRYSFPVSEHPIELEDYVHKTTAIRYFWPEGNAKFDPKDNIKFKRVTQDDKTIGSLIVNSGSPFLFLSNSYFAYPLRAEGASVPGYTAYFIQHIPDWFYQDGIGNSMLRNLVSDHNALSNRKVVIMVGHPSEWKDSFPPFPRYLLDDAKSISQETILDFLSPDISNLDNGSFLFTKDDDGATQFTQNTEKDNPNKSFSIELSISHKKEKKTCMLRVNFETSSYITINVSDCESKEQIDSSTLSPEQNQHVDFCIPVSSDSRRVSIEFRPAHPNSFYSIKNIELWYY